MAVQIIEGTWEEIERRKEELVGHQLLVAILPQAKAEELQQVSETGDKNWKRALTARGKYKGILSTDEYFREKREDTVREDA